MAEPQSRSTARASSAPAGPEPGTPAHILVADDEEGTLSLMVTTLTWAGFTVTAARDGLEALVRARESSPDLALLDVMMPGLDGRDVCRQMAADSALAHVPVILQSAADEQDIDWRGCGAVAFLRKPFRIRELPELLRGHLAARPRAGDRAAPRRTDDEIADLARRILNAVQRRPASDPPTSILSPLHALSPEDEARLEAALTELLKSDRPRGEGHRA